MGDLYGIGWDDVEKMIKRSLIMTYRPGSRKLNDLQHIKNYAGIMLSNSRSRPANDQTKLNYIVPHDHMGGPGPVAV